jgi:hypothetical protein
MIFKTFSPKKFDLVYEGIQKLDHVIGYQDKHPLFRRKLVKIAKNGDHNIDPWA